MILEARAILDTATIKRLTERLSPDLGAPGVPDIMKVKCAASLAHHGLLDSVDELKLWDVDLSLVPAHHLASLVSCVTGFLSIETDTGLDLVNILSSVSKIETITISTTSTFGSHELGREETQALVRAMEDSVEGVTLYGELDTEALAEYSGQGACRQVEFYHMKTSYKEELRTLVRNRNWRVGEDEYWCFIEFK